jgi:hypothetical protein
MKSFNLVLLLLTILSSALFGQDTIYKTNGSIIIGKVNEVRAGTLIYVIDDHLYSIENSSIGYVAYANGTKEKFNYNRLENYKASHGLLKDFQKNIVTVNTLGLFLLHLNCAYERILPSGMTGIRIPVLYSVGSPLTRGQYEADPRKRLFFNAQYTWNKIASTGLEINFYPLGQAKHAVYGGLSGSIGSFYYYDIPPDPNGNGTYDPAYEEKAAVRYRGLQYAGMVHAGYRYNNTECLILGAKIGAGYRKEQTIFYDERTGKFLIEVYMGYKFN